MWDLRKCILMSRGVLHNVVCVTRIFLHLTHVIIFQWPIHSILSTMVDMIIFLQMSKISLQDIHTSSHQNACELERKKETNKNKKSKFYSYCFIKRRPCPMWKQLYLWLSCSIPLEGMTNHPKLTTLWPTTLVTILGH